MINTVLNPFISGSRLLLGERDESEFLKECNRTTSIQSALGH